jgi:hypothetical protein
MPGRATPANHRPLFDVAETFEVVPALASRTADPRTCQPLPIADALPTILNPLLEPVTPVCHPPSPIMARCAHPIRSMASAKSVRCWRHAKRLKVLYTKLR